MGRSRKNPPVLDFTTPLQPGDVVILTSQIDSAAMASDVIDVVRMSVLQVNEGGSVECAWFWTGSGDMHHATLPRATVALVWRPVTPEPMPAAPDGGV